MLLSNLRQERKLCARQFFEKEIVKTNHLDDLSSLRSNAQSDGDQDMVMKIALKHDRLQSRDAEEHSAPEPFADIDSIQWGAAIGNVYKIRVSGQSGSSGVGLAEESTFGQIGQFPQHSRRKFLNRLERLRLIAQQLSDASKIGSMQVLPCLHPGFYYSKDAIDMASNYRSGLIYRLPDGFDDGLHTLTTLEEIMAGKNNLRMTIDQRYALAHMLASSLHALHHIDWLHRRISAVNIIVFYDRSRSLGDVSTENFYLLGFAQSRNHFEEHETEGNETDEEHEYYQHPLYFSKSEDFHAAFDYYALGILLIELGCSQLMKPLCERLQLDIDLVKRNAFSNGKLILDELEFIAGKRYRSAVQACLNIVANQIDASLVDSTSLVDDNFRERVLNNLDVCRGLAI